MALFTFQVFKTHPFIPGRAFSNTYTIPGATLAAVLDAADSLVEYEREIHDPNFTITYVRISSQVEGDDDFATRTYNLAGVSSRSGDTLPLFNTLRLDVNATTGRPSRWHYRGLHEGEVANNEVALSTRELYQDAYAALRTALNVGEFVLVQPDGNGLASEGTAALQVKLRKLHRRRRKAVI